MPDKGPREPLPPPRLFNGQFGRVDAAIDPYVEGTLEPIYGSRHLYDGLGRLIGSQRLAGVEIDLTTTGALGVTSVGENGEVLYQTKTIYDEQGRVAATIAADGSQTDFEYDQLGRKVFEYQPVVTFGGEAVRHRIQTIYDAGTGRVTKTISNVKWRVAAQQADISEARETTFEYDQWGNVAKTIFDDGSFTKAEFDNFGRRRFETDQVGNVKEFEYDDTGRLVGVKLPEVEDPVTEQDVHPHYQYGYDTQGNQTTLEDPLGRVTEWTFDHAGRELSRKLPSGLVETTSYDNRGRMQLHVSFEGVVTTYVYDDRAGSGGRLTAKKYFASHRRRRYAAGGNELRLRCLWPRPRSDDRTR